MNDLTECIKNYGSKKTEAEKELTDDPTTLPLTKKDRDAVVECVQAQNKVNSCRNCRYKCGAALRKGFH